MGKHSRQVDSWPGARDCKLVDLAESSQYVNLDSQGSFYRTVGKAHLHGMSVPHPHSVESLDQIARDSWWPWDPRIEQVISAYLASLRDDTAPSIDSNKWWEHLDTAIFPQLTVSVFQLWHTKILSFQNVQIASHNQVRSAYVGQLKQIQSAMSQWDELAVQARFVHDDRVRRLLVLLTDS